MNIAMNTGPGPIEPIRPNHVSRAHGPGRTQRVGGAEGVDAVAASAEIQAATEAVRAAAEVRAERIAAVKAKIASGEFKIDAAAIADAIINGG